MQSDILKSEVVKLCYAVHGTYQIVHTTGRDRYLSGNKPDNPELKCLNYKLYPLSWSFEPYKPIDTTDTLYLNETHVRIIILFKKLLYIDGLIHHLTPICRWFFKKNDILQFHNESLIYTKKLTPVPRIYYL